MCWAKQWLCGLVGVGLCKTLLDFGRALKAEFLWHLLYQCNHNLKGQSIAASEGQKNKNVHESGKKHIKILLIGCPGEVSKRFIKTFLILDSVDFELGKRSLQFKCNSTTSLPEINRLTVIYYPLCGFRDLNNPFCCSVRLLLDPKAHKNSETS